MGICLVPARDAMADNACHQYAIDMPKEARGRRLRRFNSSGMSTQSRSAYSMRPREPVHLILEDGYM